MMMNGSAKYSELGTAAANANPAAAVAAFDNDNYDDDDAEAGVMLVATPVPAVTTAATERVDAIAPASLPGGYELHCDYKGRSVVVRVPPEGVKQGQRFSGDAIRQVDTKSDDGGHHIPTGKWRDGLFDCFAHGIFHPTLWLACFCKPLAIGQILTRMNLTAMGTPIPQEPATARAARWSAFAVLAWIFAVFFVVHSSLSMSLSPYKGKMVSTYDNGHTIPPDYASVPAWAWFVRGLDHALKFAFLIYLLALLISARSHVRHRYGIPEHYCSGGLEDCCCSFWCMCCTTLQIARHTADYTNYPASCCSETGLHPHHPHDFDPNDRPAADARQVV